MVHVVFSCVVFILSLSIVRCSDASHGKSDVEGKWIYGEQENWPTTCQGLKQSPVPISDETAQKISQPYTAIKLINYENKISATCENNGLTVKISINPQDELYVIGGGLRGKYSLSQIHFHWTSEHTINGKRIPLEGHFVHINSDNKLRVRRDAGGINTNSDVQVLAVMYKISLDHNKELADLIEAVQHVKTVGSTKNIEFVPKNLLPDNIANYYRYEGSLTTPPCYEIVQWTVFAEIVSLSLEQYEVIRDVESYGGPHKKNFREMMPINERVIKFYNSSAKNKINMHIEVLSLVYYFGTYVVKI